LDLASDLTLAKRDVQPPGTGEWIDFYTAIKSSSNTIVLNNDAGGVGTISATEVTPLNTQPQNVVIGGLYGCISVIAVSHRGKHQSQRVFEYFAQTEITALRFRFQILLQRRYT
jgi:hypothetical protein